MIARFFVFISQGKIPMSHFYDTVKENIDKYYENWNVLNNSKALWDKNMLVILCVNLLVLYDIVIGKVGFSLNMQGLYTV